MDNIRVDLGEIEHLIDDPRAYGRIITVVEQAIADAEPPRPFRTVVDGQEWLSCPWETKGGAPAVAERSELHQGFCYQLQVRDFQAPDDPYAMTSLTARTDRAGHVFWQPGAGGVSAERFLAWWEAIVHPDRWVGYKADYPNGGA
jgi:hypothetical protein